jgi:hypothetical protein
MTTLAIASIRLDGGTQSRACLSAETTAEYTEAIRAGAVFPKPVVFFDGKRYWLADGFHRVAAHVAADHERIECDVRQGDMRAAILHSVGANAAHGLRRSNADKRRAVEMLLRDEEWAKKSDRWIADKCGVSDPFVGKLRELLTVSSSVPAPRVGKDGKTRKLPSARPQSEPGGAADTPVVQPAAAGPHRVVQRRQEVRKLHAQGFGTIEIAAKLGVPRHTISADKAVLGVNSASAKLWSEVEHAAIALAAAGMKVEEIAGRLAKVGKLPASKGEIDTCVKRVDRSLQSIRCMRRELVSREREIDSDSAGLDAGVVVDDACAVAP